MKVLLTLLTLAVALALLKLIATVLTLALLAGLVYAVLVRPRDTLLLLGGLTLCGVATAQPLAFCIACGFVAAAASIARTKPAAASEGGRRVPCGGGDP